MNIVSVQKTLRFLCLDYEAIQRYSVL